jgi:3-phenylpropionate/trans-cinnamate dioxygenase ferredoxin reductase subunit
VVVVGGGFIGAEVAAACRTLGLEVTLLEILAAPMERVLGTELGGMLASVHRAHGVDLRLGEGVAAFRGSGRVEEVVTTRGMAIPCAFALVGVGMQPQTGWLDGAGVALEDGVLVGEHCESSVSGVFAAGDAARWPYHQPGMARAERVRLEHWDNALRQGEAAARGLLGQAVPYAAVPYFWSDQYDLKLQYVGYARVWERIVLRGDPATGAFAAFYLADGRVRAALAVNHVRDLVPLKKLIGVAVEVEQLGNEAVELRALAAARHEG